MTFFGITESTASWALGKPGLLNAFHDFLIDPASQPQLAGGREFVEGPIRISFDSVQQTYAVWNSEYLNGTGDDSWGFVDLSEGHGLRRERHVSREAFERSLYVVSQRLQGLLLDGAFIHRAWPNGAHTCLAGRGTEARHFSLGYIEHDVQDGGAVVHALLCTGPEHDLRGLQARTPRAGEALVPLVHAARRLYDPSRRTTPMSQGNLLELRRALVPFFHASPIQGELRDVAVQTAQTEISAADTYRTAGWTYQDWLNWNSPLSTAQRRVLTSDALDNHPVRITGPAGSGKTLLMQLLALRRIELAKARGVRKRILYLFTTRRWLTLCGTGLGSCRVSAPRLVVMGAR